MRGVLAACFVVGLVIGVSGGGWLLIVAGCVLAGLGTAWADRTLR